MKKVVTVVGARPQFVKAATVSRALRDHPIEEVLVHTGQHHDANMSDIFFTEMEIPSPRYNLAIQGLGHGAMTGRMLEKIEEVLLLEKPDYLMVYGDTNSTLAGALAASKLHIPVVHVEAGLRSFNMEMPEEVNRILTDRISNILFCPTQTAVKNLQKEGFDQFGCEIIQNGDVMFDAAQYYRQRAVQSGIAKQLNIRQGQFCLVTLHRAENTNDVARLRSICNALNEIHNELPVVLPLHPRTKGFLKEHQIPLNVIVVDPVGYFDMLSLLDQCRLVFTDSGGLQKEAYFFNKFCITLRDQTEWIELVDAGANALAGANQQLIVSLFHQHKQDISGFADQLYGDGHAAAKIAERLSA
ncbi:MAG: UDP-N-acetylglucosamine 2-epimerase (non-hydrolyzing) [Cyclobacteriaceae bacterium]